MTDQPPSYAKRIWDLADDMLGSRKIVGKLVKTYGEPLVMSVIGGVAAMRNPPADLKAYIVAALEHKSKLRGKGTRPMPPVHRAADQARPGTKEGARAGAAAMREKLR